MNDLRNYIDKVSTSNLPANRCKALQHINMIVAKCKKEKNWNSIIFEDRFIRLLVKLLKNYDNKIKFLALRTVSLCMCNKNFVKKIIDKNLITNVTNIMQNDIEDHVQYYFCNIISNFAKYGKCVKLHEHGATGIILNVLNDSNSSVNIKITAIRAIRLLYSYSDTLWKAQMLHGNVLETVGKLFKLEDNRVLPGLLLCIHSFVKFNFNLAHIIPKLIKYELIFPIISNLNNSSIAQETIFILSKTQSMRFELCKAGIMEKLISVLQDCYDIDDNNKRINETVLASLFFLCQEAHCRARLREISNSLKLLLKVASEFSSNLNRKCSLIIFSLFQYDESAIFELVKNDFLITLMKYLENGMKTEECCSVIENKTLEENEHSWKIFSFKEENITNINLNSQLINTNTYSQIEFTTILNSIDELKIIYDLLRMLSVISPPIAQFATHKSLKVLTDCLFLKNNSSSIVQNLPLNLLLHIARTRHYFSNLLSLEFPLMIHQKFCRPNHENCNYCEDFLTAGNSILSVFMSVATTAFGSGLLCNELMKKDSLKKSSIILMTPFITNPRSKSDFYIRYDILNNLLQLTDEELHFSNVIAGLYTIASKLEVKNPFSNYTLMICQRDDPNDSTIVEFLLDDCSVIPANKNALCDASPVFKAMLLGNFKESKDLTVVLHFISSDSLILLNNLISKGFCHCVVRNTSIPILLETLIQCDKFLLSDLYNKIFEVVLNVMLSCTNCHLIYNWCMNYENLPLVDNAHLNIVQYFLAKNLKFDDRVRAFNLLLNGEFKLQVKMDIKTVINDTKNV